MAPVPSHAAKRDARPARQMARGPCGGVRLPRHPREHQAGRRKPAQASPQDRIDRSLPMLTRRGIVAGAAAVAVFAGGIANSRRAAAFASWPRISPADAGFAPDLEARLDRLITSGRAWKQHGVVIARKGALVLERYDPGEDENWGRPIGRVNFGPETLHDLRSVTKSILGLLYGIALARGKAPAPDQPLLASFPDYADVSTDPRHKLLTIGNAL